MLQSPINTVGRCGGAIGGSRRCWGSIAAAATAIAATSAAVAATSTTVTATAAAVAATSATIAATSATIAMHPSNPGISMTSQCWHQMQKQYCRINI